MATSPILGLPLPNSGGTDQVPADLMTLVTAAEKTFVGAFATTSARDTKITAPTAGMVAYTTAGDCFWYYSQSGAWKYLGGAPPLMIAFPGSANWTTSGVSSYALPKYYLDGNGIVRGQGCVQYVGGSISNPIMGVLPVGYRPLNHVESVILGCTGAGSLATYQAEIDTLGNVKLLGTVNTGTNIFLNTLTFNPNN